MAEEEKKKIEMLESLGSVSFISVDISVNYCYLSYQLNLVGLLHLMAAKMKLCWKVK